MRAKKRNTVAKVAEIWNCILRVTAPVASILWEWIHRLLLATVQRPLAISTSIFFFVHSTFFFWIRSDEGLTLETSAFRISVRWPIYIINSVDKTKFLYTTSPPTQHHSFFRNYPFIRLFFCFDSWRHRKFSTSKYFPMENLITDYFIK